MEVDERDEQNQEKEVSVSKPSAQRAWDYCTRFGGLGQSVGEGSVSRIRGEGKSQSNQPAIPLDATPHTRRGFAQIGQGHVVQRNPQGPVFFLT